MNTALLIIAGLVALALGGEFLVRGTVGLARRLGVSPLLAGLVIVGFGTSAPELVTSLQAATSGVPDLAVGNVVGSNIANILLILGVSAIIIPLPIAPPAFYRDGFALSTATLAALAGVLLGGFDRLSGILLAMMLVTYIIAAYLTDKDRHDPEAERHERNQAQKPDTKRALFLLIAMTAGGIAGVVFGAQWLIEGSVTLARGFGISEAVIGLTIVAVGTSLPELVACVAAALKKEPDVALGNIVGSGIYNIFGILGITAAIVPLPAPAEIAAFDIFVLTGVTALLMLFLRTGWTINRKEGAVFVVAYLSYLGWQLASAL
ncbi:calcium/sodium antiporter [Sphingomicrobium sp. XHP0235]|uniref:calcium/sodium antiporter n=1 Tax=Sphingomicrobium aquimarinum TaxID=3133971 RepID=UPI0031FE72E3